MAETGRKVVVTGSIRARPERIDELLALCLEHVRRSRSEPGCIAHAVHRDVEEPLRLVFVEEWADRAALLAHFAVPASRAFVKAAAGCAAGAPTMALYEVDTLAL
ncbi:MAG: antibiotic biosynthesis monooxygenase [Burkholderiaceae bacterium]|jgi:quinol monooxygenase YgiN|nr:antibiotic biosynthesis monooxygenase [Burkholderiaceae bacterium]MCU0965623.1 antibiotic biosynthesis monooxygenase [Burkholderiaceae bacterium]